ncbi:hypothetical protein QVD17_08299 [Tagetes erecta]|uniref:Integrase catalytic domain-containing protein n=1 Tax=Tagetes erecta TaxID=13708 RepID=A0AAD8KYY8_TARER|nr:hypothetical protein QVD17_08299 [Tagetes erecta]
MAGDKDGDKSSSSGPTETKYHHLHPVYSVTNIQNKVRTLDGEKVTFASWTKLFKLQVKGFKVAEHIDGTLPPPETDPEYEQWMVVDAIVLQWIYGTISDQLLKRIIKTDDTALQAWNKIRAIFLNNKSSRAATLEHQFSNLTLSACSSFDAYCEKLKEIADQLEDIEEPVSESRLVLQLVRGLPSEYNVAAAMINQAPTSWDEARNKIQLEQDRLQAQSKANPTQTALTTPSQQPQQHQNPPSNTQHHNHNNPYPYQQQSTNQYRGRGRGRNNRGGGRGYRGRGNQSNGWNNGQNNGWNGGNNNGWNGQNNGWNGAQQNWNGQQQQNWNGPHQNWNGPPPCPHPAQQNWTSPWTNKNANGPPPGFANQPPQANYAGFDIGPNPMCPTELGTALQSMQLNNSDPNWYMDTGASSHLTANPGKVQIPSPSSFNANILVGNGQQLKISGSGNSTYTTPAKTIHLNNILIAPQVIKDLIAVRKFTRENIVSIEFDPYGFTLKDLTTGMVLSRHDSTGDLYPFTAPTTPSVNLMITSTTSNWHNRLGHPGQNILHLLSSRSFILCNKDNSNVCHSCQISNSKRLPFIDSNSVTIAPFDIIHCDLWTSPVTSNSGYKYYMVLIDNFTNYVWIYPLKFKSETFTNFAKFHKFIRTQFNRHIKTFQCDLGGEFDNHEFRNFASTHGLVFRFSCPQTSPQNGRAERMIRRLNDIVRPLLMHASLPPEFWVEAVHTATYLHNILPTKRLNFFTPTYALYHRHPTYDHLRVFGCACYPNLSATITNKLQPRSTRCIFLGYPSDFRGYRCFDLVTGRVYISRHVVFDESTFPSAESNSPHPYTFLDDDIIHHPVAFPPPPNPPTPSTEPPTPSPTHASPPPPTAAHSQPPPSPPPTTNHHSMQTRAKSGVHKPNIKYNLHTNTSTQTISPIPTSYQKALSDPNWKLAMIDEFKALKETGTWELVP